MVVVVVVDCRIVAVVEVVLVDGGTVVDAAGAGCIDAVLAVPSELSPEHAAVTSDAMTAMAIVMVPRGRRAGSAINGCVPYFVAGSSRVPLSTECTRCGLTLVERSFSIGIWSRCASG